MSAAEYRDWQRYYVEEPWGTDVDDERFGVLATLILKQMGGESKPSEWFLRNKRNYEEKSEQDTQVLAEQLKAAFAQHNVNVARKQTEATKGAN